MTNLTDAYVFIDLAVDCKYPDLDYNIELFVDTCKNEIDYLIHDVDACKIDSLYEFVTLCEDTLDNWNLIMRTAGDAPNYQTAIDFLDDDDTTFGVNGGYQLGDFTFTSDIDVTDFPIEFKDEDVEEKPLTAQEKFERAMSIL